MSSARTDVHHHVFPPAYLDKVRQPGLTEGGGILFPNWSASADVEMMDRHGIQTAMVSIASPGAREKMLCTNARGLFPRFDGHETTMKRAFVIAGLVAFAFAQSIDHQKTINGFRISLR